ncbi:MAG: hypothetical protein A3H63_00690 [Candidatus Harrisonbacteria bacterium RIFCSPLOWO2_02_FULL_45_10c]|uniref:Peptidase S74 domain-containing protein n=1 Tax=Candidatus Harrisonbacteria bacterium RIFCSPLOWO2_02_FULL_45_10c TaxID=1798410 RepID=A0A1G1ZTA8_9BACT|nr:MAG: hypothetical protein A3H63_00690 [Candidatus Harrisonbacteria bacterium RIFCSPLOWO2_02_FULL_45_10c]
MEVTGNANFYNGVGINGLLSVKASTSGIQTASIFSIQNATGTLPLFNVLYYGRVGIGTSSPWGRLSVEMRESASNTPAFVVSNRGSSSPAFYVGGVNEDGRIGVGTSSPWGRFSIEMDTHNPAFVVSNFGSSTPALYIGGLNQNGNVGIGTIPGQAYKLHVTGAIAFDGLTAYGSNVSYYVCLTSALEVVSDTVSCLASSLRYKDGITDIDSGLEEVLKLHPVNFYYKPTGNPKLDSDPNRSAQQFGFIAEEVQKIDSRLIGLNSSGTPETFRYENFTAVLAKAIQELNAKIDTIATTMINVVKTWLESMKIFVEEGIVKLKELVAETITADKLQLRDAVTGNIYCIIMENGEIQKTPGSCGNETQETLIPNPPSPSIDTESPVITLNGPDSIEIEVGVSWIDPGATVTDNVNNNLGIYYSVDGAETSNGGRDLPNIDTGATSTHTIIYSSTDQAGNTGTAKRLVTVSDSF